MASRIRILSESVSNMIAAGEVVEGPFSIVKELVENALDAGATEVTIVLKGGGTDLVRVSDNGTGMNADDALAAFDRFATSKLSREDDLAGIATLGFRGEALPSVASVSRMRLVTCEEGEVEGTEVTLVGGEVRDVLPAGRAPGTTVEVSALFFNTPARRKFLKSNAVEFRRIMDLLTEYAVLYPKVRFDVESDGRAVLGLMPADDLKERVAAVIGSGLAKETLPVARREGEMSITGLVGKPSIARARGAQLVVAVNGRPIRSRLVSAAIRAGYGELLPRDRHPVVFLVLEIGGGHVDVNVHPTKREVRFSDTRKIFGLVEGAVRQALLEHDAAPTLATHEAVGHSPLARPGGATAGAAGRSSAGEGAATGALAPGSGQLAFPTSLREAGAGYPAEPGGAEAPRAGAGTEEIPADAEESIRDAKFWQLHEQYVFVQTREGVIVIDQHAAHERVLYEKARKALSGVAEAGPSQQLLFPVVVELSVGEAASFEEVHPLLDKLGFTIRPLSGRTVLMESVPAAFPKWPHERIIQDILSDLPSGKPGVRDLVESISTTVACHAAIKAGDPLKQEEMRALVDQLFATELPYSCPHGRPTFMRMTIAELDKRFGRS